MTPQSKGETGGKKQSFFEEFQDFSSNLQTDVSNLKKKFETKPRSDPKQYDQGLRVLKSEITSVKNLVEDTKIKVQKIQEFSHFVVSTKDLVEAQEQDFLALENFLKRYGYKPPAWKHDKVEQQYVDAELENHEVKNENRNNPSTIISPELSEVGKSVLQGRDIPVKDTFSVSQRPTIIVEDVDATTPEQKPKSKYYTQTPTMSSRKRMEQWIASVEAATAEEALGYERHVHRYLPLEDDSPTHSSIERRKDMQLIRERKYSPDEPVLSRVTSVLKQDETSVTPEEPVLSCVKGALKQEGSSVTPEEPGLSTEGSLFVRRLNESDTTTPEEPTLHFRIPQATDYRQPVIQFTEQYKFIPGTPQSPQLSDITQKILNVKKLYFEEDTEDTDKLSTKYSERCEQYVEVKDEPESPQLSDLTLKIIGKNF